MCSIVFYFGHLSNAPICFPFSIRWLINFHPLYLPSPTGLSSLRLVKVEIPAYKFRGESALLECVYELNGGGVGGQVVVNPRTRVHQHHAARYRQPLEYISNHEEEEDDNAGDEGVLEEEFKYPKRKRKKYARFRKFDAEGEQEEDGDEDEEEEHHLRGGIFDNEGDEEEDDDEVAHFQSSSSSSHQGDGFPETLYSVKWYKDNEEFYRYVPKANPPQNSYKVDGIRVDVSRLLCLMAQGAS